MVKARMMMGAIDLPIVAVRPLAETATIALAAEALGLTEKAIRRKIEEGVWIEGRQYHRAPDGKIYVDIPGVTRWVRQGA